MYNEPITMKKLFYLILILLAVPAFGQEEEQPTEDRPVRSPFETGTLIENQTIVTPMKGSLEMLIHHRFGTFTNGIEDLYGIYAPSNIRLGINYGITDRLMAGFGTEKDGKLQELQYKYQILRQTRSGKVPVGLTFFGNMSLDARDKKNFGPDENYRFIHRLSYFSQLIVARKFTDWLSLQVAPSFIYYNAVEESVGHIHYGVMGGGRAKFTPSMSFLFEYSHLLSDNNKVDVKPNVGLGLEISTATHAFQVFATQYRQIVNQYSMVYNTNGFDTDGILIGFNITVRL